MAAIGSLPDVEREKLFTALVRRYGDTLALRPAQLALGAGFAASPPVTEPDYILVFDGGAQGNPGPGYGSYALLRRQDGGQEIVRLEFGGEMTNNEAEYESLIAGLKDLLARIQQAGQDPAGFTVEVRGDSALVINQVAGAWKAKDARMKALRGQVRALLSRFAGYNLRLQPRKESVRALGH
ncbi:MAG: ribonuclease HI family protein [Anaerolineae bacterium]|jgi:ribonuclease HI|nr:ribonuclease HI family protein [Anaerolineae bacterium]